MNTSERRKLYTPEQLEAEREYRKRRYAENRERLCAQARADKSKPGAITTTDRRKEFTPEQRAAELSSKRKRYRENREQALAYAAKYREENAEQMRERRRGDYSRRKTQLTKYRLENGERITSRRAAWKSANADRVARVQAEWTKANLDKHRTYQHNRRARKQANGGSLSPGIVQLLLKLQRGKCACCRQPLGDAYELDHIVPLALGGPNSDDNVQLLRARCNRQKGAKHPMEFMQVRGMLL